MSDPRDDETPADTVARRFPMAGEISSGDAANAQSNRARLRYYAENESDERPREMNAPLKRKAPVARPNTRLAGIKP